MQSAAAAPIPLGVGRGARLADTQSLCVYTAEQAVWSDYTPRHFHRGTTVGELPIGWSPAEKGSQPPQILLPIEVLMIR